MAKRRRSNKRSYRRRRSKRTKRSGYYRRTRRHLRRPRITSIRLRQPLIADKLRTKFNYYWYGTDVAQAGLVGHTVKLNCMFNIIDNSGNTWTIPGVTNWAAFYSTYTISAARIQVKFYNTGTVPLVCGIYPHRTTSFQGALNEEAYIGNPAGKWRTLAPAGFGNDNTCILTQYMTESKLLGGRVDQMEDVKTLAFPPVSNLSSAYACAWDIWAANANGVAIATHDCAYSVRITYYVTLTGRDFQQ